MAELRQPSLAIDLVIGSRGPLDGQLRGVGGLVVCDKLQRLFVCDADRMCMQAFSIVDGSFLFAVNNKAQYIAIDDDETLYCSDHSELLRWLSALTGTVIGSLPRRESVAPSGIAVLPGVCAFVCYPQVARVDRLSLADGERQLPLTAKGLVRPRYVAVDSALQRVIVGNSSNWCDERTEHVYVFTINDAGRLLFHFDARGHVFGLAVDYMSRIIVVGGPDRELRAFTSSGDFISRFTVDDIGCGIDANLRSVACDKQGRVYVSDYRSQSIYVIGAARWLPFHGWTPDLHRFVPEPLRRQVLTVTLIRSLEHSLAISLLPNELLFEIFVYL